jgi:hypothetical protein
VDIPIGLLVDGQDRSLSVDPRVTRWTRCATGWT